MPNRKGRAARTGSPNKETDNMSNIMAPNKPRTSAEELRDEFMDSDTTTSEVSRRRLQELRERAERAVERSREKVREYPMTSLLCAAGVGVVIGMLVNRRRNH